MESLKNKQKIGLVAYDNVSSEENRYLKAFRSYYQDSEYYFQNAWSSIEELQEHIRSQGSATLNELSRIIMFDSAFSNQNDTTRIVNQFVSLEELMDNRNVTKPILSFTTTNQQVFDLFKEDLSPEGHDLFPYKKTKVYRIKSDKDGNFNMGDLNKLLKGQLDDSALAIKNEYQGREAISRQVVEDFKKEKLNQEAAKIDELLAKKEKEEVKEEIKNEKDKKEYQTDHSEEKEKAILHHTTVVDVQTQDNQKLKDQLSSSFRSLRKKSLNLNYDAKIFNDHGTILVGGIPGSGVSSVVANLSMYYAICNKKVLIVNLSNTDHITRYFKDYQDNYHELGRKKVMMTQFSKKLSEISVPVAKNIDLISDFGIVQKSYSEDEMFTNYDRILRLSSKYDITFILAEENIEKTLEKTNNQYFNDLVFVSTLNDFNDIDVQLFSNLKMFNKKINSSNVKPGIIINKIEYYQNQKDLSSKILSMNQPFDSFRLIGYFSYDNEWFTQIESGCPLVPRSRKTQNDCHEVLKNLILR